MTEPQQLILIAEVERLLRTPPLPSVEALDYVRSFLLSHRSAADVAARAQPASTAPAAAVPADGLAQRRAGVNTHREALIRRCQEQMERDPLSIGSQLAAPHPPLTGRDKTPATLAQFGAKLKERTEKVGKFNVQADENLDMRFDPNPYHDRRR